MLTEITSHLHPILVHFPIALIAIAVGYDLVYAIMHRSLPPKQGLWLWLIAAVSAWLAVSTGPEEDAYGNTTFLDIHSMLADATAWVVTALTAFRLFMHYRNKQIAKATLALYLVISIASLGLVLGTGYYGGKMVYSDGVGVKVNGQDVNPSKSEQ
ncbi:hypothetical protein PCCS19_33600 [Paenibacillus sp. CCS19]|uniref:DUF2231 domain-containing protein n=1 Tax=Paenibacillus sp. CCS19 TaxID=3158387 RepID=UPI0025616D7A|nr:DUF2231 domain-containing protein [Paenibacillus cellulosilyticus]GMK40304.1 hypothetical protein PCCS19_33600 [Paenibacillus cellulosilyticus]